MNIIRREEAAARRVSKHSRLHPRPICFHPPELSAALQFRLLSRDIRQQSSITGNAATKETKPAIPSIPTAYCSLSSDSSTAGAESSSGFEPRKATRRIRSNRTRNDAFAVARNWIRGYSAPSLANPRFSEVSFNKQRALASRNARSRVLPAVFHLSRGRTAQEIFDSASATRSVRRCVAFNELRNDKFWYTLSDYTTVPGRIGADRISRSIFPRCGQMHQSCRSFETFYNVFNARAACSCISLGRDV